MVKREPEQRDVVRDIFDRIDLGLSVLSDRARSEIKSWILAVAQDAYRRGYADGRSKPPRVKGGKG